MNTKEFMSLIFCAALLTAVVLSPVACQVNRDKIRTEAISKAVDPIATSCALDSIDHNGVSKAICTLKAGK